MHAHVPSNETLYEFIRQEFPLSRRGIVGGGARKQQRNDERVERKEYHLKGNSPSHRKTVPPQLAKPAFCRFAYGKKKKKKRNETQRKPVFQVNARFSTLVPTMESTMPSTIWGLEATKARAKVARGWQCRMRAEGGSPLTADGSNGFPPKCMGSFHVSFADK